MRVNTLPQPILAKLLMLEDHARACEQAAVRAEAALALAREILNGKGPKTGDLKADRELYQRTEADFHTITLPTATAARARASTERAVPIAVKGWVTALPEGTGLEIVAPVVSDGVDLAQVRAKVLALRAELTKIRNAPVASDDIRARVEAYVNSLARGARPLIRGFEAGRELNVSWPMATTAERRNGAGFDDRQSNSLLTMALFFPEQLVGYLCTEIDALSSELMPAKERPAKLVELERELEEWLRLDVHFVDRAIEAGEVVAHDPQAAPWVTLSVAAVVLGINVAERETKLAS